MSSTGEAIENLKNVPEWTKTEAQTNPEQGISAPVNESVNLEQFEDEDIHWTEGTDRWRTGEGQTIGDYTPSKTFSMTSSGLPVRAQKIRDIWNTLSLKGYTDHGAQYSLFKLPFGTCYLAQLQTYDEDRQYYQPYNYTFGRFFAYNEPEPLTENSPTYLLSTALTPNIQLSRSDYPVESTTVNIAFINNEGWIGVALFADGGGSNAFITIRVHQLNPEATVMLGTQWHKTDNYENSDIFGNGGVAQGLQGIVDTLTSDVNVPLKPNKGVTGTGFVNIYAVGNNDLTNFGREMFSDVDIDFNDAVMTSQEFTTFVNTNLNLAGVTLAQVPQEVIEESLGKEITVGMSLTSIFKLLKASVKNFFSSQLIKYVLSVHVIPVSPNIGTRERINVGYKTFTQEANRVSSDYIDFDCGTLTIPSKYKNFLDFTQTKAKIYLPFIGMVDISPQYFYDCTIGLKYRFSVIDGTCVAFLTSTKMSGNTSLIGTYNGSCCLHIPFTGENYANMITGVIQGVGGVASGVATANPMLALGGAIQGASSIAEGMSGSLLGSPQSSSSASFMGVRTPYIIIERPIPQLPPSYFEDGGAVAMITERIGNCEGFTKCKNVHCSISTHKSINDKITQILETGFHA